MGYTISMPDEHIDRLEALNRKLFSKDKTLIPPRRPGVLYERDIDAARDWSAAKSQQSQRPPMIAKITTPESTTFFKKLFLYSLGFLVLAVGFAFFVFERGSNAVSGENIDISILGNTFTPGGEELSLQLAVTNKNAVSLEFADLVVTYPKGAGASSSDSDLVRIREPLGTLGGGKTINKSIKVVLYGEQGSKKDVTATLEYRIPGSNAIFTKASTYPVTISSAPLTLTVDAPTSVASNQEIILKLKVTPNATKMIQNVTVRADYPPGFQFKKATPEPSDGSNVWTLGDLAPGIEKEIEITGQIFGQDNEDRSFRFASGEPDANDQSEIAVVYSSLLHTVTIARPFIDARLLVNGADQPEYTIPSKSRTDGSIEWINNSPARVENVEIRAKLTGNALNRSSVIAFSGFYNSATNEIIWDRNTTGQFAAINPGESGSLSFSFESLGLQSSAGSYITDPTIIIEINMKGTQTTEGSEPVAIDNAETKTIKVSSDIQVAAQAGYRAGPFTNTGSVPPRAEQETTYAIIWTLNNTANPVSSAEVKTVLPTNVRWLGTISPSTENVSYNEITREVTWRVGQVPRGAGGSGGEKEAAFQVGVTPSITQIGSSVQLIGETVLTGTDSFTGVRLEAKRGAITSQLFNDPGFPVNGGTVTQ